MKLGFGYNAGLPDDAQAAWGARIIVTQDGAVDILWDRTDCVPEDNERVRTDFLELLSGRYPNTQLRTDIADRLRSGEIKTREAAEVELYDDAEVRVVGNSNASAGYFYVTAYRKGN